MNISLYSPNFPPKKCGVGDFTSFLMPALQAAGNQVKLNSGGPGDEGLIQYTPYLFRSLWACLKIFSKHRGQVSIFFHELYFPPSWSLRGLLIGVPHWLRFVILLHIAKRAVFSTAGFHSLWSKRLPYLSHKMSWVPVGSTIPVSGQSIPEAGGAVRLLHFGGAHPTHLYDFVFHAFKEVSRNLSGVEVTLELVGVSKDQFPEWTHDQKIRFRGYADPMTVSQQLSDATLVLAPFLDGVTTRRSTLMCALSHARLVVTTSVPGPDLSSVPWSEFLVYSSMKDADPRQAYADKVVEWLKKPQVDRVAKSARAKDYYENHFAWKQIAQRVLSSLE